MIRYIPPFILRQCNSGVYQGSFQGFAVMMDIAHFSKLIRELHTQGHQGAEELVFLLNASLGASVKIVRSFGGFVAFFAGDAICALFPEEYAKNVLPVVNMIRSAYSQPFPSLYSPKGIRLQVRQVVAYGTISWEIFPGAIQHEYLFSGEAFEDLPRLAAAKASILFSEKAARKLGTKKFSKTTLGYTPLSTTTKAMPIDIASDGLQTGWEKFIRTDLQKITPDNEVRSAAICFLRLAEKSGEPLATKLGNLEKLAQEYGGFINKLMPLEKGVGILVLFGLPHSKGKTLDRAAKFALEAVSNVPQAAIGIACGMVFAGYTCAGDTSEYTAYGEPVNLAARLMDKAEPGVILCDSKLYLELYSRFRIEARGKLPGRGVGDNTCFYSLGKALSAAAPLSENSFVGRESELETLNAMLQEAISMPQSAIIYISGDPGIGKTRLARELASQFRDRLELLQVTCEEILRNPLDAIKQLLYQVFQIDPQNYAPSDISAFRKGWQEFAGDNDTLQEQESVLASLLNLQWPDSFWSMLPLEAREMHLHRAIQAFLERLCQTKLVLILLDDGQWLDEDSLKVLQDFSAKASAKMLIISPCRYLGDGSKVDMQLANFASYDLELGSLAHQDSHTLILEIIGQKFLPLNTLEQVQRQGMGNPLFIEQICYYLLENKLLSAKGMIISSGTGMNAFGIHDIIANRIDGRDKDFREVVLSAAVLGVEFSAVVLAHMLKRDISAELQEGMRLRLWKESGKQVYAFTHVLIRDVAYRRLLGNKLHTMHQHAAEAFAGVYTDSESEYTEEMGWHYHQAKMLNEAARCYDLAGNYHWGACSYSRAEKNFHTALKLLEKDAGTNTPDYSESLFHLGLLYHYLLEHATAETIYLQVLEFQENYRGKDDPGLSPYLNNLGRLYKDMGRFAESEVLLNKSLQIEINNMPTSSNVADRMNNIGHLYTKMKDFAKALPYYQEAVKLMGANYSFHPYYGGFINNLAMTYLELGRLDEAEPLIAEGMKYTVKAYGEKNPATATQLASQGRLYVLQRKYKAAHRCYLPALAIFNSVFGPANVRTKAVLQALCELSLLMGKPKDAKGYRERLDKVSGKSP